jgi:GNAT superfamily N-acetyltransferase
MDTVIRAAGPQDLEILWDFLAMAAYEPDAAAVKAVPMAVTYLIGWKRPSDFGVIAERNGSPIGATWARQFSASDESHYHVNDRTPELSIGVSHNARGQGVGQMLLSALIKEARHRGLGLCLNVRTTNPAAGLYERMGFEVIPGAPVRNRVGGFSIGMVLHATGSQGFDR